MENTVVKQVADIAIYKEKHYLCRVEKFHKNSNHGKAYNRMRA